MGLSAAVVLAAFGCAAVSALSESHAQTFFTLKHNEPLQHTVDVRIGDYGCKLTFDAGAVKAVEPIADAQKDQDIDDVLHKLAASGKCAKSKDTQAHWQYTVCPNRDVTQAHAKEHFSLGSYALQRDNTQLFRDGSMCAALRPPKPRSSIVEYVCGTRLAVVEATEVNTCEYVLVVTTPEGCGVPSMNTPSAIKRGMGGSLGAMPTAVDRPWKLEIEELPTGHVACSAYVVDDLKVGGFTADVDDLPLNPFTSFTMEIWRTDEVRSGGTPHSHSEPLQVSAYAARAVNRRVVPAMHTAVHRPDGVSVPASFSTSDLYTPAPLEFIRFEVLDSDHEDVVG